MTITNIKKKNYCLDFIKGIACICVVFMHCEFPGYLGIFVQCISRFCVPFFFMVSGYFCYYEDGRTNVVSKKIQHIGKLILWATLFYIVFGLIKSSLHQGDFSVSLKSIIYFIVFNEPVIIAGQLWFLFALLYDYILYGIIEKLRLYKMAYILIPIFLICYIVLAQGMHLLGIGIPNIIYRNFLIEGFPLFMLGHWLHKNYIKINVSNRLLLLLIVISTVMCPIERIFMGRDFGVNIVSFLQVTALFIFAIKNPDKFQHSPLNVLGEKYSMLIYILHPFIWQSMQFIYSKFNLNENIVALYSMPILVLILSIILTKACNIIKDKYIK